MAVQQADWEVEVGLEEEEVEELQWVAANKAAFNGRGIHDERGAGRRYEWRPQDRGADSSTGYRAILLPNGQVDMMEEVVEQQVDRVQEELDEVLKTLVEEEEGGQSWHKVIWDTSSRASYQALKKGSCLDSIHQVLKRIAWVERAKKISLQLMWGHAEDRIRIQADWRAQITTSTDEWGVDREE